MAHCSFSIYCCCKTAICIEHWIAIIVTRFATLEHASAISQMHISDINRHLFSAFDNSKSTCSQSFQKGYNMIESSEDRETLYQPTVND